MLALIAGQGSLPRVLVQAHEGPVLVYAVDGFAPEGLTPDGVLTIGTLGPVLAELRARGVTGICLAGSVRRPRLDPSGIHPDTFPLIPRLQKALTLGDDGALRVLMEIFEEAGFAIVSATDILAPLVLPEGTPTRARPGPQHRLAAGLGQRTVAAMGARDAGQACVVTETEVLAREDQAGTDAMLRRIARDRGLGTGADGDSWDPLGAAAGLVDTLLGSASDWLSNSRSPTQGGILFKAPKPGQDRRADLPVIGPATADHAAAAGLDGIVIEAGGVMVLERDEVVTRLDAAGLFLWVRPAAGEG